MKTKQGLALISCLSLLLCVTANAATITNTGTGNWNSTTANAPWPGGTVPALSDTVYIAGSTTVTITDTRAFTGPIFVNASGSNGKLVVGSGGTGSTLADITINSGGILDCSVDGQGFKFGGNVTNNGSMTLSGGGSANTTTFSGGTAGNPKFLAGNLTNDICSFSGTYVNVGVFRTGLLNNNNNTLQGAGALTNLGVIYLAANATPTLSNLVCTNGGNSFVHFSGQMGTTPSITFYNLTYGACGGNVGVATTNILYNLTVVSGGNGATWPANLAFAGSLNFNQANNSTLGSTFTLSGDAVLGGTGANTLTMSGVIGGAFNLTK